MATNVPKDHNVDYGANLMGNQMQIASLDRLDMAYLDLRPEVESTKTILLIHGFASNAKVNWVGTGWTKVLLNAGYRVIAIDNRGHGESTKFYKPEDYGPDIFAADALALMDHLEIERFDVLGYSMGARITCWLAHAAPKRVRRAIFGGMGSHIFGNRGGYDAIAEGLEVDDPNTIADLGAVAFRKFADHTGSDRMALAACIRPSKQKITQQIVQSVEVPVLVAVGDLDEIGGSATELADMMSNARGEVLEGLDHMRATGAPQFKTVALNFLGIED